MFWGRPRKKEYLHCRWLAAAMVLTTVFPAHPAMAAESYFDLTPAELLNADVITATKTRITVDQAPAAVYVITSEDIARSGVTSIADALRMAPGVDVAQGTTGTWDINIRGFNRGLANQLLVMIDGRTIYNPLFAGTYWELQNLPVEDIARIEVIRGPGGTLWGANAVNGVINIITKKAQDTQGSLVRGLAGTYYTDSELAQRGGRTEDGYYRTYVQHMDDGPLKSPNGGDTNQSLRDDRAGFRYDRDDNLTVSGDAYINHTDQLFSVPRQASLLTDTPPYTVTQDDNHDASGADLIVHWRKKYDDGAQLSIQSYLDYTGYNQIILNDKESMFDIGAQYNLPQRGRNQLILGGGYRLTHQDVTSTSTLSINPAQANLNLFNVFAQDRITLLPHKIFLTLGTKVEHNSYTGFEFEPNARLQWFPDYRQAVWLAVSRAVRTPSPYENEVDFTDAVLPPGAFGALPLKFEVIANPDFSSEHLVAYEAGYRNRITPKLSSDTSVFANDYTHLDEINLVNLVQLPAGGPTYTLLQVNQGNQMTAETYGIEEAAEWSVTKNWNLSGSYSVLEMFLHPPAGTLTNVSEGQSPQHEAGLRSYWNVSKQVTFDTALYYVGELPDFHVPAYYRLDVNFGWKISPGVQFNIVGQNLLQARHMEYGNITDLNAGEVPRSFYVKVTCSF